MTDTAPIAPIPATGAAAAPRDAVAEAFDSFRATYPAKPLPPERVANAGQVKGMLEEDGLKLWSAGSVLNGGQAPPTPTITAEMEKAKLLWAVEKTRVPYAPETCDFGRKLESRVIKHSNLTGGGDAHCAGEMVMIDKQSIVVNGQSGRYGPKSEAEMLAVAKAFKASGYNVWSMGYDQEAGRAHPFIGLTPSWVT